eukprot:Rmarinus@m.29209
MACSLPRGVKVALGSIIAEAYRHETGRLLSIDHSFSDGWFCTDIDDKVVVPVGVVETVSKLAIEWLSQYKVEESFLPRREVLKYFKDRQRDDKLAILKIWRTDPVPIVRLNDSVWDYRFTKLNAEGVDLLSSFCLLPYRGGILLRFPHQNGAPFPPFIDQPKVFDVVRENEGWGRLMDVATVGQLNTAIYAGRGIELLLMSESLHAQKLMDVTKGLIAQRSNGCKRIVCVAGPSSSGKTTTTKRLQMFLKVLGRDALILGMDDYYRKQSEIPVIDGKKNYEMLESLDTPLLVERVQALLRGEDVPLRKYSFQQQQGHDTDTMLSLHADGFVLIEGIHGLNPIFCKSLGEEQVQRVFVCAVTQLNIDEQHHFSTCDHRLIRRMLRDHRYRGYSVTDTLQRWPAVRENENLNIFPYQEHADFIVNTCLVYELAVLANYCRPLLAEAQATPEIVDEVDRLFLLLSLFYPMSDDMVPHDSVLREFCGGSIFDDARRKLFRQAE